MADNGQSINLKQNLKAGINAMGETGKGIANMVNTTLFKGKSKDNLIEIVIYILIIIIFFVLIVWAFNVTRTPTRLCDNLNYIYQTNNSYIKPIATIHNISSTDNASSQNNITNSQLYANNSQNWTPNNFSFDPSGGVSGIFSYYVKTAYNCCSPGNFKNSFVQMCALNHVIKLGARCLDFEIYSLNGAPIISTSSESDQVINSFYVKQTFNYLNLEDVLLYIKYYALSDSQAQQGAPNYTDPLFLHFRIMTQEEKTINLIAKYLVDILNEYLLGTQFGYNNHGNSIASHNILEFCGKCIIMVEYNPNNSTVISKSNLNALINISTNTPYYNLVRYSSFSSADSTEIINFNKYNMTMVLPNISSEFTNFNPSQPMQDGCQFVAMNFQNFDSNLEFYFNIFDEAEYSFVLKPCSLRTIPVHYIVPEAPTKGAGCPKTYTGESGEVIQLNIQETVTQTN